MNYILMNKYTPLIEITIEYGHIVDTGSVFNRKLMPLMFPLNEHGINRRELINWWYGRQIPASRNGLKDLIWSINPETGVNPVPEMAEKMLGFSLSDQYWIKPTDKPELIWDKLNFFTNEFSEDIGKILVGQDIQENIDIRSPDNTSDGVVKKRWKIINGKRCLLKGYSSIDRKAEPFRECLASLYFRLLLPDNYVAYTVLKDENGDIFSCCENFITPDTEYVSFNQINSGFKRSNNVSPYNHAKQFYGEHGYILDLMLIGDFIVANTDRHFGNFGLIRDVYTGDILKPAPIFDTGASLYHDTDRINILNPDSKPFKAKWKEQLQYIDVKNYFEQIKALQKSYADMFIAVFSQSPEPQERKEEYLDSITQRINYLLKL